MSGTPVATAAPATLGRRAFAYFTDWVMFWIVALFVVAFLSAFAKGSAKADPYTGALLSAAVGFAYFFSWTTATVDPLWAGAVVLLIGAILLLQRLITALSVAR